MELIALLPPVLLGRLRVAVGRAHEVREFRTIDALANRLGAPADVVIVHPDVRGRAPADGGLRDLFTRHPAVPVLFYTPLASGAIIAVAPLLRDGLRELVIAGVEDQPGALRSRIEHLGLRAAAARLLAALEPAVHRLPPGAARAVHRAITCPRDVRSVSDIADAASMSRRHLARVARSAGLASPRSLLAVARSLFVHHAVRVEHRSLRSAAMALRCDPRALSHQLRVAVGTSSPRTLAGLDDDELVRRCLRAMHTRPLAPADTRAEPLNV